MFLAKCSIYSFLNVLTKFSSLQMPHKQAGFIDRLPIICAAGKDAEHCESVGDLLRVYTRNDFAEELVKGKEKLAQLDHGRGVPATPVIPENNQLNDILAPDLNKSCFLEFRDRFYENLYCKKVPLGKAKPTNSKPDHVTNESITFGEVSVKGDSAYEITLPKKSPDEVLREYVKWHDKYRLSHGDYFPSEQIKRGYNEKFDANRVYGRHSNADVSGTLFKGILQDNNGSSKTNIISKAQEKYITHHQAMLGQPLKRQEAGPGRDTVFGHAATTDEFHVRELLRGSMTSEETKSNANVTTYRAFATDIYNSPVDCRRSAGQVVSKYPRKGECKMFAENLGEETTVKQLVSPSIPTHFGLSHRDFLVPRPKDQIRRIFSNAGFELKDEEYFSKVWTAALSAWTSIGDQVSVEAFKYALQKIESESK